MTIHDPDALLSSTGSAQVVRSPASSVLSRRCDAWHPSRFTSFPSIRDTLCSTRPWFRSRCQRVHSMNRAWSLLTRLLRPGIMLMETSGSPKFPWSLICPFAHVPATPAGQTPLTLLWDVRAAPAHSTTRTPTTVLSRLHGMASRLAIYASWCRSPIPHARLAPGCWSSFAVLDFHP